MEGWRLVEWKEEEVTIYEGCNFGRDYAFVRTISIGR